MDENPKSVFSGLRETLKRLTADLESEAWDDDPRFYFIASSRPYFTIRGAELLLVTVGRIDARLRLAWTQAQALPNDWHLRRDTLKAINVATELFRDEIRGLRAHIKLGYWDSARRKADTCREKVLDRVGRKFHELGDDLALECALPDDQPLTPDQQRKKFCFDQWQDNKSHFQINRALEKHPDWMHFEDPRSVRKLINEWGEFIGKKPRRGQPGRRPKA